MNKVNSLKRDHPGYPKILADIPSPPAELFWHGADPNEWLDKPKVAIVGSRKMSAYGSSITNLLATELAQAEVVIISGLAYGVDACAHQAALAAGGITVAVLPGGVDVVQPAAHNNLAKNIVDSGGTLLSEYPPGAAAFKQNFVARNRIVSGLADVLLITEASSTSGSLHTARFALDQNRTVMAVPGNITSPTSQGTNNLIKSGATPVTSTEDVLFALNIKAAPKKQYRVFRGSAEEEKILMLIRGGMNAQEELALTAGVDGSAINSILTMLEIGGYIKPQGGGQLAGYLKFANYVSMALN